MDVSLRPHQLEAVEKLDVGKILCGGVGSGKSRTALAYFYLKVLNAQCSINGVGETTLPATPTDLYIVTTAKKRDSLDWEREAALFALTSDPEASWGHIRVTVDSWNNIKKYADVKNAFFIFDEQRLVGTGVWVKTFYKIVKNNSWILLSATPGDTWIDYIPVFVANGYYHNAGQFKERHVVYHPYVKYPKIVNYVGQATLVRLRDNLLVDMPYAKTSVRHNKNIMVSHNPDLFEKVWKKRWHVYEDRPLRNSSELFHVMRKVINSDLSRRQALINIVEAHDRVIVFYNFNYELDILRGMADMWEVMDVEMAEWNGHKHEAVPNSKRWVYIVQYTSGSEGWNCTTANTVVFYSLNYSYRVLEQSSGRVDRLDTPYKDLYLYTFRSSSSIDKAIMLAVHQKRVFNEADFLKSGDK